MEKEKPLKHVRVFVFVYLWFVVTCGEGEVNDQTEFLVFFVQSVQQLPGTEHIRTRKLTVQRLMETHTFSSAAATLSFLIRSLSKISDIKSSTLTPDLLQGHFEGDETCPVKSFPNSFVIQPSSGRKKYQNQTNTGCIS